jgi:hypothetical protein
MRYVKAIAAIVVVYLAASFIAWDMNPGNLSAPDRFLATSLAMILALFAFLSEDLF